MVHAPGGREGPPRPPRRQQARGLRGRPRHPCGGVEHPGEDGRVRIPEAEPRLGLSRRAGAPDGGDVTATKLRAVDAALEAGAHTVAVTLAHGALLERASSVVRREVRSIAEHAATRSLGGARGTVEPMARTTAS